MDEIQRNVKELIMKTKRDMRSTVEGVSRHGCLEIQIGLSQKQLEENSGSLTGQLR